MNQLSLIERERVFADVHGVADAVNEEPHFVDRCLAELQTELEKIPTHMNRAYVMAHSQCPEYVNSKKFRLMFLRTDSFQPQLAALRIVEFLAAKLELFGPEKFAKDIELADLDEGDIACLESGYMQLLPGRDRSGRPIVSCIPYCAPVNATHVNKVSKENGVVVSAFPVLQNSHDALLSAKSVVVRGPGSYGGSRQSTMRVGGYGS
jgi:hypothetical protein